MYSHILKELEALDTIKYRILRPHRFGLFGALVEAYRRVNDYDQIYELYIQLKANHLTSFDNHPSVEILYEDLIDVMLTSNNMDRLKEICTDMIRVVGKSTSTVNTKLIQYPKYLVGTPVALQFFEACLKMGLVPNVEAQLYLGVLGAIKKSGKLDLCPILYEMYMESKPVLYNSYVHADEALPNRGDSKKLSNSGLEALGLKNETYNLISKNVNLKNDDGSILRDQVANSFSKKEDDRRPRGTKSKNSNSNEFKSRKIGEGTFVSSDFTRQILQATLRVAHESKNTAFSLKVFAEYQALGFISSHSLSKFMAALNKGIVKEQMRREK